jgi:hypothetical protein
MPISFYKVVFDEDYTLYTQIFAWYMLSKEWKRSYIQEQRMTTLLTWGAIGYLGGCFGFLGPCAGGLCRTVQCNHALGHFFYVVW